MEQFSYVLTIFIMLLGPIKLIPAFAGVMRERDEVFRRSVAIRAALITAVVVAFVALAGGSFLAKYHISIDGLRIAGGLVLLVAALNTIFGKAQAPASGSADATPLQIAISPLVTPIIVPPAGVAAILIFMMLSPEYPGMPKAVGLALAIVLVLDFLAMRFNRALTKPWLMQTLQLLGAVLIFMQVAIAIETILIALRSLRAI